jgi:LmbE family N-acetylglucosaminyl deacetylase
VWAGCRPLRSLPIWEPAANRRFVVVAPHPDEEILGAGGTLSVLAASGALVDLVAVTDGENSHPGREDELRRRRPVESAQAAETLGLSLSSIRRLGHPDGQVDEDLLAAQLSVAFRPDDVVLAPWAHDGHPDHDRAGRAARTACAALGRPPPVSYLVWAWHWASAADIPWSGAVRVRFPASVAAAKRRAARCFTTQVADPDPILPPHVLARLTRDF